jgi:hypothetical protein
MKVTPRALVTLVLIGTLSALGRPSETPKPLRAFTTTDPTISKDVTLAADNAWAVDCKKTQTIRLFEFQPSELDKCMVLYRAKLKTESLDGQAYLEMWCRFPGKGEFFSRGLENTVSGSNDWASYETPFFLKKGEKPDLIKLNLVVKGTGKLWVKDVELVKGPLPEKR